MATFIAKTKNGPKRWKGQVWKNGKMAAVKWFGTSKADQRAAIVWEEETKKKLAEAEKLHQKELLLTTPTISSPKLTVMEWANAYLEESERRNTLSTFKEKKAGFKRFIQYLAKTEGLAPTMFVEDFGRREARLYLAFQKDQRGPNCSNKDRKVLTTAWRFGVAYLDGFPLDLPDPFLGCQRYPEIRTPRYIPPEADFWKVYLVAPQREQALLLCYLNLAARKSELLRLTWDEVDFSRNCLTLTTRKTRTGNIKHDEMPMNQDVRNIMLWLWQNRLGDSNFVFTLDVPPFVGQPYKTAGHIMKRLCTRAGVKPFGFHAIRHLATTILAQEGHSLFSIQHSLRHEKQSTTDRYLHGLGAFKEVADALGSLSGRKPMALESVTFDSYNLSKGEIGYENKSNLQSIGHANIGHTDNSMGLTRTRAVRQAPSTLEHDKIAKEDLINECLDREEVEENILSEPSYRNKVSRTLKSASDAITSDKPKNERKEISINPVSDLGRARKRVKVHA